MKYDIFISITILISALITPSCAIKTQSSEPQSVAENSDFANKPDDFSNRKPFKYTITTDNNELTQCTAFHSFEIEIEEGMSEEEIQSVMNARHRYELENQQDIKVSVAPHSMDGKFPLKYDLDCDGDGIFEQSGLTEGSICTFNRNTGHHQIALRGDIHAMELCPESMQLRCFRRKDGMEYDRDDIVISVDDWGDIEWKSMESFDSGCGALKSTPSESPDLSHIIQSTT